MPAFVAWGVFVGELVAPVMLILGIQVRVAAFIVVVNMLAAVYLVHMGDLLAVGEHGSYRLEIQAFYLMNALAIMLLGGGRFALDRR